MSAAPIEPATEPIVTPAKPAEPPVATATPEPKPIEPAEPKATEPSSNVWDDPKAAQAEIERLRRENGASRTNAKAAAAEEARNELAQTIGKAIGLVKDEPIDPAKLTEELTTERTAAQQARVELAVFRAAGAVNGDPAALLDSTSFLKSLDGVDPTDTGAVQAAISKAIETNPRLGAATDPRSPAPNPAQGTSATGPGGVAQLTKADVERLMSEGKHNEVEEARQAGRLNTLLGIK